MTTPPRAHKSTIQVRSAPTRFTPANDTAIGVVRLGGHMGNRLREGKGGVRGSSANARPHRKYMWLGVLFLAIAGVVVLRRGAQKPIAGKEPSVLSAIAVWSGTSPSAPSETRAEPSSIAGEVRDSSGAPVESAVVCAVSANTRFVGSPENACAGTNARGAFSLEGLPPGGYVVRGTALGFAPGVANGARAIVVSSGERKRGVNLTLTAGGAKVSGVVIDATGGRVAHALVHAARMPAPSDTVDVLADDQGRFALSISPGVLMMTATSTGYSRSSSIFPTAPTADVVLVLVPGASISGTVMTKDGLPVAGVRVFAQTLMASGLPSDRSPPTNDQGQFTVTGLAAGSYELTAEGNHFRGFAPGPFEVDVADAVEKAVVVVEPATAVTGRVVTEDKGEPCQSGKVTLRQPDGEGQPVPTVDALIEPTGDVRFAGLPPGTYGIDVFCANHRFREGPRTLTVRRDDISGLLWKVGAGNSLVVRTIDAADHPVPFVSYSLQIPGPPDEPPLLTLGSTDAEGRHEYAPELDPGRYVVKPTNSFHGEPVTLDLGPGTAPVTATLRLEGSAFLAVNVRTKDGKPARGLSVTATALDGTAAAAAAPAAAPVAVNASSPPARMQRPILGATSVGDGRYRFGPLSPGRYEVSAEDGVNPTATAEQGSSTTVTVLAGSTAEAVLTIDRGASITGRVLDDAGGPKPNVWVSASQHESSDPRRLHMGGAAMLEGANTGHRVLTDLDGRFHIDGLQSGALFDLAAQDVKGGTALKRGVRTGEDVALSFPPVGTLRGTALDGSGRPVSPSAIRIAQVETGWSRMASVKPDGTWELTDVGAGRLHLEASDSEGRFATGDVDLGPHQTLDQIRLVLKGTEPPAADPSPPPPEERHAL
jgi:hypothetical protein